MSINVDAEKLRQLMDAFYTLTGIRFILFDTAYQAILSYPESDCGFCSCMKGNSRAAAHCRASDTASFEKCRREGRLIQYECHAGLIEAAAPLKDGERVIGYVMFGQVTDQMGKRALRKRLPDLCAAYGLDPAALFSALPSVRCKNLDQIAAAAQILEACTSYILLKELITSKDDILLQRADAFIAAHLSDVTVSSLCAHLAVSRTKLYALYRDNLHTGVSEVIRSRRLRGAKTLLKTTELSIAEIAARTGFSDYNYFSRVFKRHFGRSPRSYQQNS